MYYQFTVMKIDNKYMKISELKDETLFMNIYHYWCFVHFLSPYYSWENQAIKTLRINIILNGQEKTFQMLIYF